MVMAVVADTTILLIREVIGTVTAPELTVGELTLKVRSDAVGVPVKAGEASGA
jgi:hypothetical protein